MQGMTGRGNEAQQIQTMASATARFLRAKDGPRIAVLEAGGWEIIKQYVALGMGISIVTDVCLTGEEALAVYPMDQYFPTRSYGIVSRRGKFLSAAAARYLDMLREYYAESNQAEEATLS